MSAIWIHCAPFEAWLLRSVGRCLRGCAVALAALSFMQGTAQAQLTEIIPSLRGLETRVLNLEAQVGQLIQQTQTTGAAAGLQGQQLGNNMADLSDEIRQLTGQVEDLQFAFDDLRALQSALLTFEQRLAAVEQRSEDQAQALAQALQAGNAQPANGQQAPIVSAAPQTQGSLGSLGSLGSQGQVNLNQAGNAQVATAPEPTVPVLDNGQSPENVAPAGLAVIAASQKPAQSGDQMSTLIEQNGSDGQVLATASEADRLYQTALDRIKRGEFETAQPLLQQFIDAYSDHPLLQNAQYWMGETFYAQQDFDSAAAYFTRAYRQDAQGPKAPDTLLKLGFTLFALNRPDDGCKFLSALFEKHENARQEVLTLAANTMSERGC